MGHVRGGRGWGERGSMNEGVGRVGARMADEWPAQGDHHLNHTPQSAKFAYVYGYNAAHTYQTFPIV